MSWTEQDLADVEDAIRAIIKSGAKSVAFPAGQSLERLSLPELQKLKAEMIREINATRARAAGKSTRYSLADFG